MQGSHAQWASKVMRPFLHFLIAFAFSKHDQTETQKISLQPKETLFFYSKGDQALEQVAQRACGVSLLGEEISEDIQKPLDMVLGKQL